MAETDEFTIALAESDAIEPMMQIPSELPVLPLRDIVIYPFMIVPLFVRDRSIRAVEQSLSENRMILLVSQKDVNKEEPKRDNVVVTYWFSSCKNLKWIPVKGAKKT